MHKNIEEELEQFLGDADLRGKNTVVMVEDREDEFFWEEILSVHAPGIKPDFPYSSKSGKDVLRRYIGHLSKKMLVCADSDNDAHHQTKNSEWLNPRKLFVYQTYAHSRENHFVHPENLLQECRRITHSEHDFKGAFAEISEALHPFLILWLFFTDKENTWLETEEEKAPVNEAIIGLGAAIGWKKLREICRSSFEKANFENALTIPEAQNFTVELKLSILAHEENVRELIAKSDHAYLLDNLAAFSRACTISPDETLWFIQGHCAFDHIMVPYFDKIVQLLAAEKAALATTKEERNHWEKKADLKYSNKELLRVSYRNCLLSTRNCRFFDMIKQDLVDDNS